REHPAVPGQHRVALPEVEPGLEPCRAGMGAPVVPAPRDPKRPRRIALHPRMLREPGRGAVRCDHVTCPDLADRPVLLVAGDMTKLRSTDPSVLLERLHGLRRLPQLGAVLLGLLNEEEAEVVTGPHQ